MMEKIKENYWKIITGITGVLTLFSNKCFAVEEVEGGGAIQSSVLGTGLMSMIKDLTGTLQWLIPVAGVLVILFYVFKIMTGDEQDQMRYKKAIIKVLICIVISVVAVTIVNLVTKYF